MTTPALPSRLSPSDGPAALPLAPFLESLRADGIRPTLHDHERIHLALRTEGSWTAGRLRSTLSALLVRDAEQQAVFLRRFDRFFALADWEQAEYSAVDLARSLADLGSLDREAGAGRDRPEGMLRVRNRRVRPVRTASKRRLTVWAVSSLLVLVAAGLSIRMLRPDEAPDHPPPPPPPPSEGRQAGEVMVVSLSPESYQVPVITDVREVPDPHFDAWKGPTLLSAALLAAFLGYGGWLRQLRRPLVDQAPAFDPDGPRLFRAGKIGGEPAPRLDRETLDLLADALGYFRSEETGSRLDVERSVAAAGRHGGIPRLVFERRKKVRSVVVLEDVLAEPSEWNPIAGELARGLTQRGVPVLHGRFRGVPERFSTSDGSELELDDLEDDRHGYLLLVFSDGKGLRSGRDRFVLETLSRWPAVAWMELRERRAWDESTAWPARFGLPLYPASRSGLLRALGRFATERSSQTDDSQDRERWRGGPTGSASRLAEHDLERLLGDALPWARSCSMMVPPLSLGLADALRRRFHPELPPERVERLVKLPGVSRNDAGLRFSPHLLALLRQGFLARNDEERQVEVLEFLLEAVRRAEPSATDSLEYHAWEWRLERLRLEIEPDRALKRLAELAKGPLKSAVQGELRGVGPGDRGKDRDGVIPLRLTPKSQHGRRRLQTLAGQSGVSTAKEPVDVRHQVVMVVLGLGCLAACAWTSWVVATMPTTVDLRVESAVELPEGTLEVEVLRANAWETFDTVALEVPKSIPLQRGE